MAAAILSLGTELTRGDVINGNAAWLAERLTLLGHEVIEIATTDDDDERIEAALQRLARASSLIVCTGGLGPTTDDRTSAAAARAAGVPLLLDLVARAALASLLEARGRQLGPDNEKQAYLPEGASMLPNAVGTAPGFGLTIGGALAFFLPGVPSEMQLMFEREVQPRLPIAAESWLCLELRTCGMAESQVGQQLAGIEREHAVTLGYRASAGGVAVKVLARTSPATEKDARKRAEAAFAEVQLRLAPVIYAHSATPLERVLGDLLKARGLSIGLAESCTGGGMSELLTRVPGASAYFRGAVVAYDNRVKAGVLGVPQALLDEHGAVSREVALAMASGARKALGSDVAVSITGIAGPEGGTESKPVGLVHWAFTDGVLTEAFQARFSGTRAEVQRRATTAALFSTWNLLRRESTHG